MSLKFRSMLGNLRGWRLLRVAFFLFVFSVGDAWGQLAFIPYSRNDSAQMHASDSLHDYHLGRGDLKEASRWLDLNAMLFWQHNELRRAEEYFLRSLGYNERLGNQNGIAGINSNLAFIYSDLEEYEKAYDYFEMTLAVRRASGNTVGVISALVNESVVLNNLRRYKESVVKLEEALRLAREMNDEKQMRSVYGMLSETYQKADNAEKALYYYNYYKTFNDYVTEKTVAEAYGAVARSSLERENLRLENENKELLLAQQRWELSQQAGQLSELTREQRQLIDSLSQQEMANQILENRNEQQRLQNELLHLERGRTRWALFVSVGVLVLIIAFLLVSLLQLRQRNRLNRQLSASNLIMQEQGERIQLQYAQLEGANRALQEKSRETLDSIRYSRRVQEAVFRHNVPLGELFPDSFLFERPSAIVSGDFHYTRRISSGEKLVVVGDCTGHGVPGAFLTVLAVTILDRAIYDMKLRRADLILDEIDRAFSELNGSVEIPTLSMDVGICIVDEGTRVLQYAGAYHHLLVIEGGEVRLERGSNVLVGHRHTSLAMSRQEVALRRVSLRGEQWFYMFSDGISDQFGAHSHVKFSRRRLHDLLRTSVSEPAFRQRELLVKALAEWQGEEAQIDDMILLGFSVSKS